MKMNFRIIAKFAFLAVIFGFCMPIACDANGFQIANSEYAELKLTLALYAVFIFAIIGLLIGAALLMKKNVPVVLDWVVIIICMSCFLIPFFMNVKKYEFQEGAYVILVGFAIILLAQIISALTDSDENPTLRKVYKQGNWNKLYKQGKKYQKNGDYDEAIKNFTEALSCRIIHPLGQANVYKSRGESYKSKGDMEQANADFDAARQYRKKGLPILASIEGVIGVCYGGYLGFQLSSGTNRIVGMVKGMIVGMIVGMIFSVIYGLLLIRLPKKEVD